MVGTDPVQKVLLGSRIYYGWYVVLACFLTGVVVFSLIYSFNVFLDHLVDEFGRSTGAVALLFSLQSIVVFGFSGLFGLAVDRYGARPLLAVAAVLTALGLTLVSQLDVFVAIVLVYGILVAVGIGIGYIVTYATVPRWFGERRGTATAIAISGSGIGIMLGPLLANALIQHLGWRGAYLLLAFLSGIVFLLAGVIIADTPDSVGADSSNEFQGATPTVGGDDQSLRNQLRDLAGTIRSPTFSLVLLGFLFMYIPAFIVLVHIVSHVTVLGLGRTVGVYIAALIGGMNIIGKYVVGPIVDRHGEISSIMACAVLLSVGTFGIATLGTVPGLLLSTLVFGLGYGGGAVLISPVVARFFGESNLNSLTGAVSAGFAIAGAIGPPAAGLGFDIFGSYRIPMVTAAVLGLLAAVFFKFANLTSSSPEAPG